MSTPLNETIDFKAYIECDNSPFILFDDSGKIVYLNNSAEILLGYVEKKTLYELCIQHAPKSYGFKTITLSLQFDSLHFYAVTVGYRDDEHICIRLYHKPRIGNPCNASKPHSLVLTDINILLETSITWFQLENRNKLSLLVDQDIPPFYLDQNLLSKLFRKVLHAFRSSDSIDIALTYLAGEFVIINGKKEAIIQLQIKANGRYYDEDNTIESLANEVNVSVSFQEKNITLHIPCLKSKP